MTTLFIALALLSLALVIIFLLKKHYQTKNKNQLIHLLEACIKADDLTQLVKFDLNKDNVDIPIREEGGHTPLHYAASQGSLQIVRY